MRALVFNGVQLPVHVADQDRLRVDLDVSRFAWFWNFRFYSNAPLTFAHRLNTLSFQIAVHVVMEVSDANLLFPEMKSRKAS